MKAILNNVSKDNIPADSVPVQEVPLLTPQGVTWENRTMTFTLENIRGDASTIGQITSITSCTIEADGVTLNFANCKEMTSTTLTVKNGGVIQLPKLERYSSNASRTWHASEARSRIEVAALTTNTGNYSLNLETRLGGVIDVSKLATVPYLKVDSQGSQLRLMQ
jgi:hypothetical protein